MSFDNGDKWRGLTGPKHDTRDSAVVVRVTQLQTKDLVRVSD